MYHINVIREFHFTPGVFIFGSTITAVFRFGCHNLSKTAVKLVEQATDFLTLSTLLWDWQKPTANNNVKLLLFLHW